MNIVSLFAGCGGLDLGFEQAGFNVVWANEYDKTIHETYKLNHPHTVFCGDDIRGIKSEDIPDCDGIIGGPPCQSWSVGGKGRGFDDERGKLFLDYIRIVEDKKPKFFVIENVAGILEDKHRPAFNMFLKRLKDAGYKVEYELLNAADYVIPQDRFRVFIIGIRNDFNVKYHFPEPVEQEHISLKRAIGDIVDIPQFSEGKITPIITEHNFWNHDVYTGPYSDNYMHSNRVRSWDEVSFTIQAQASNAPQHPQAPKMVPDRKGGRCFVPGKENLYRRLSVRECARIQTFPDSFHFIYTNVKDGYKMVGNAVPPRLACYLAKQIAKTFGTEQCDKKTPRHSIKRISVTSIAKQYKGNIIKNATINEDNPTVIEIDGALLDMKKQVLVSLVKPDNAVNYVDHSAKLYYTGKKFPSTVALNKLYYFMPYIKGKGVKDLYYIKVARIGTKQEVFQDCTDLSSRLVFEIEFVKQIFEGYMPVKLDIFYTYKDTNLESLFNMFEE